MLIHQTTASMPPKRVVVIGAGGFVGSTIVQELTKSKTPTLALTRKEVDLLSSNASDVLRARLNPDDAVVLISAITPAKTTTQMMANLRMVEAACAAFAAVPPAHLLYVSSDAVYTDDANPVTEASPVSPSTTHGMMHAARELMLRTEYRGPLAYLRPTLIYGAGDPHSGYGPNRFRREAMKGGPIKIFGMGEEKRDHIAVNDVARLATLILFRRSSGALNAATGISTAFSDIAHLVAAQFDQSIAVTSVPRAVPRPHLRHRFFDITNCYKAFPDFRFSPLAEGLARARFDMAGN